VAFYTDKASLFRTAPKMARDEKLVPRTSANRAAYTDWAGTCESWDRMDSGAFAAGQRPSGASFGTAQGSPGKRARVAGARTLDQANQYLEEEFLPWWNQHLVMAPATAADAHRPLVSGARFGSLAQPCRVAAGDNDYTFALDGQRHRIYECTHASRLEGRHCRGSSADWTEL